VTRSTFQTALDRIIDAERQQFALQLAWVRLVAALAATFAVLVLPVAGLPPEAIAPTRIGAVLFVAMGGRSWHCSAGPLARRLAGFSVALLDVPMLAVIRSCSRRCCPARCWRCPPTPRHAADADALAEHVLASRSRCRDAGRGAPPVARG